MSNMIFKKNITCPVCQKESKINALKKGAFRIIDQDMDLDIKYDGFNPLYYDVLCCNNCGYTDISKFFNKFKQKEIPILLNSISSNWKSAIIPDENNIEYAVRLYKLALLNRLYIKTNKKGELALIHLRLSYIYKALNDDNNVTRFRNNALACLEEAYMTESFPLADTFDQYYAEYLLAMLYFYKSNKSESTKWVGKVIVNPSTPYKIKEKARDLKEMINSLKE